jgi:hypothetical protein
VRARVVGTGALCATAVHAKRDSVIVLDAATACPSGTRYRCQCVPVLIEEMMISFEKNSHLLLADQGSRDTWNKQAPEFI